MIARVHINQHRIRSGEDPIIVRTSRGVTYHKRIKLKGPAEVIWSPDKPLSCGAKVWIETTLENIEVE